MALRDAIDSALEAGDCPIEIPYSHFGGVARVDRDPEGESAAPTSSVSVIKMWLGALVVGVVIAFILGLGMGGAILLIRWLKEWLFG